MRSRRRELLEKAREDELDDELDAAAKAVKEDDLDFEDTLEDPTLEDYQDGEDTCQ